MRFVPATTTIELCEGWNLIGFPAGEPRHPYAALSSIAGKWERIFGYDAFDSQGFPPEVEVASRVPGDIDIRFLVLVIASIRI